MWSPLSTIAQMTAVALELKHAKIASEHRFELRDEHVRGKRSHSHSLTRSRRPRTTRRRLNPLVTSSRSSTGPKKRARNPTSDLFVPCPPTTSLNLDPALPRLYSGPVPSPWCPCLCVPCLPCCAPLCPALPALLRCVALWPALPSLVARLGGRSALRHECTFTRRHRHLCLPDATKEKELIMSGGARTGCIYDKTVFKEFVLLSLAAEDVVLISLWIHCWQSIES